MGCHTWVYKKFRDCNKETKKRFIDKCNSIVSDFYNKKEIEKTCNSYTEYYKKLGNPEKIKEWEDCKKRIESRYREKQNLYQNFRDGVNEDNIVQFCKINYDGAEVHILGDTLYLNIGFDVPFRLFGYPEETFTDEDELLGYLSRNSDKVGYWDGKMNLWVEGYTEALVERIKKYFEEHGKDSLYFEFG